MNNSIPLQILLIEDDEVSAEALRRYLRAHEQLLHLTVVTTAAEAFKIMRSHPEFLDASFPFIILLDLYLPGTSGLEFLQELRQDPNLNKPIVIVITNSDNLQDRAAAYELGVAGYFLKTDIAKDSVLLVNLLLVYRTLLT